jgi:hypothetical protein
MLAGPGCAKAERVLLPINDTFVAVNIPPGNGVFVRELTSSRYRPGADVFAMDDVVQTPARVADVADPWLPVPQRFRHANEPLPRDWDALYGPLREASMI